MTDEEYNKWIIGKIDNNEKFTDDELGDLTYCTEEVHRKEGADRRWSRTVDYLFEVEGRTFHIRYEQGLTENQENTYKQPVEVTVEREEKVIKEVHYSWKPLERSTSQE